MKPWTLDPEVVRRGLMIVTFLVGLVGGAAGHGSGRDREERLAAEDAAADVPSQWRRQP